jgi:hypothetical protein
MRAETERERLEQVLLGQAEFLNEVQELLADAQVKDDAVRKAVRSSRGNVATPLLDPEPWRVYSAATIERLCIEYRLRFLEGGLFKGVIPGQAVLAIKRLEERLGNPPASFFVMAPSAQFKLCDSEVDPLLFVPLGDDRYYLLAKWGHDLASWRAIAFWPVRRPLHLATTIVALALLVAMVMPSSILGDEGRRFLNGQRVFFFFWTTMVMSGFTLFGWFAFFGQFSKEAWNSRYFN